MMELTQNDTETEKPRPRFVKGRVIGTASKGAPLDLKATFREE